MADKIEKVIMSIIVVSSIALVISCVLALIFDSPKEVDDGYRCWSRGEQVVCDYTN